MMDSLAGGQILSQMKEFLDGMAWLRQDVDLLMHMSSLHCDHLTNPGSEATDNTTSELVLPAPLLSNSESASVMMHKPPH